MLAELALVSALPPWGCFFLFQQWTWQLD